MEDPKDHWVNLKGSNVPIEGMIIEGGIQFGATIPSQEVFALVQAFRAALVNLAARHGGQAQGAILGGGRLPDRKKLSALERALVDFDKTDHTASEETKH